LMDSGKVKVTIMFRGREITYTAFGRRLLDRMAEDLKNLAIVEREPRLEGKNMFMILSPRQSPLGPPKFTHLDKPDAHKQDADEQDADEQDADEQDTEQQPTPSIESASSA
ncbi:MAG: translation initiation factor IF-3 C-terminal domain-containing protein, partial [Vulcanimicrobiaceae bacterium]